MARRNAPTPGNDGPPPYTVDPAASRARREEMHRQLAPSGILHALIVDQLARAAERLRQADEWGETASPGDPALSRFLAQADRSFWKAMAELRRVEKAKAAEAKAQAKAAEVVEKPVVVAAAPSRPADAQGWRARVDRGPSGRAVIRGTGVKVDDVMARLDQGWSVAEVMSGCPGLVEADIRACRECADARGTELLNFV